MVLWLISTISFHCLIVFHLLCRALFFVISNFCVDWMTTLHFLVILEWCYLTFWSNKPTTRVRLECCTSIERIKCHLGIRIQLIPQFFWLRLTETVHEVVVRFNWSFCFIKICVAPYHLFVAFWQDVSKLIEMLITILCFYHRLSWVCL